MDPVENAIDAIDEVFGDTSVTPEETAGRLYELREHIDTLLESLNE